MNMNSISSQITKKRLLLLLMGFILGFLTLLTVRVIAYEPAAPTHYHANFALYVNGQKDEFKSFTFYEEIQACSAGEGEPKARVHMHDQKNGLIHVHAEGVTWGHFFANLGYGLTDKALVTDDGVFSPTESAKLTFLINGEPVGAVANRLIKSTDRLLINYGSEDTTTLKQRFDAVSTDAAEANTKQDPATCAGSTATKVTFGQRLKYALGIQDNSDGHSHSH